VAGTNKWQKLFKVSNKWKPLHKDVTGETVVPTIYCDSNGALKTIYSGVSSPKTKHIDIQYHIVATGKSAE